jgi:hypothetical protein
MSRKSISLACCIGLAFQADEIHHAMAAAGRSDHQRSMTIFAGSLPSQDQICGKEATDTGKKLMTSQHNGQNILKIKFAQQTEKVHWPGFSGMRTINFRLRAIVRADEICLAY